MRIQTVLLVALALLCGVSAAFGVHRMTRATGSVLSPDSETVVVAAVDMPRGTLATADFLTIQTWPRKMVPAGALTSIEDAIDRPVVVPVVEGEPLLDRKLAAKGAGRGLASMISKGMRAFTIHTPHVAAGVGGFLLPGDTVDVLLTITSRGRTDASGGGSTTTLLQRIEVLAVDQELDAPAENKVDPKTMKSITLLVTPDQAAKLDLGQNIGVLHLSLRHPDDDEEANTRPATLAQLQYYQERPVDADAADSSTAPAAEIKRVREVHIRTLRGVHRGTIRYSQSR